MKKSLLIAVAALFVAIGANAQKRYVAQPTKQMAATENITMEKVSNAYAAPALKPVAKKTSRRATAIEGDYIMNAENFDHDFTGSSTFSIASQTGTITLDQYEGEPSFEYNVVLSDFTYGGAVAYGYWDTETSTIEIPVQTIYTHDTYGRIVFSALICDAEGEALSYGYEMVLDVNEDGSLSINPGDFSEEEGMEGAYASGWYSFLPDYETTSSGGYYSWNSGLEIEFFVPNATMGYTTTGKSLGGNGSSWTRVEKRVYVEDYGTEVVVNGFLGVAPISITVNGDGTCKIPFGQDLDDYDYDDPYGRIHLVGCYIEGNSIGRDPSKEFLNGFVGTNEYGATVYEFYKLEYKEAWEDEDGAHDAGWYYNDDDPDYVRYYAAASNNDSDGAAYMMGWCCNTWIEMDEAGEIPGPDVQGEKIAEYDFTAATEYPYYRLDPPATGSYDVVDGALVINNTEALEQWWNLQPFILDWFNVKEGYNYDIAILMEATSEVDYNINFGTWSASMPLYGLKAPAAKGWNVSTIENATFSTSGNDAHILFQCGAFVGTVKIYKVELYEYPGTGIESIQTNQVKNGAIYNLAGQRVDENYRGVVIKNGKKVVQ